MAGLRTFFCYVCIAAIVPRRRVLGASPPSTDDRRGSNSPRPPVAK